MGIILSSYRKAIIDDVIGNISTNTSYFYAYASNPIPYANGVPTSNASYTSIYENNWNLLFGKKLANSDIKAVIKKYIWTSNTVYARYDNTKDQSNAQFFVAVSPGTPGQPYHVYKCIDNSNGAPSTLAPDIQQAGSFTKSDGYVWRYMYSVVDADYQKFSTNTHIPVTPNTTIQSSAGSYNGVEVVVVANSGSGYSSYTDGIVKSVVNTTLIQIDNIGSIDNGFYNNNAIYIFNPSPSTSQLKLVANYVSNISGNWVYLDSAANTTNITPGVTQYTIRPNVLFDTDATVKPKAYATINTTGNTISSVVVLDAGIGVTRATAKISSNSIYGVGASLYCIVPPPGGHGSDPASELNVTGLAFYVNFDKSESNTIPTNVRYNKIGIYKNPKILNANGTKGAAYTNTTFNQLITANIFPAVTFANGDVITGSTSKARGVVAFANTTQIYIAGDKNFANGETIVSSNGLVSTTLTINTLGKIYVNDLYPIYTQNIDTVTRANSQIESFKILVQV